MEIMAASTFTVSYEEKVVVPKREYEELIRASERLAIVTNYLTNEKYSVLGTVERILGIEKAGEE
jgi:phage pi2 protein 07